MPAYNTGYTTCGVSGQFASSEPAGKVSNG